MSTFQNAYTATAALLSSLSIVGSAADEDISESDVRPLFETAFAFPPSTLARAMRDELSDVGAEFGKRVRWTFHKDPELGSSPLQAIHLGDRLEDTMEQNLVSLTHDCGAAIQPMSIAGTAPLIRKEADVRDAGPNLVDLYVQSHKLHIPKESAAERKIVAGLSYPLMEQGSFLVDHRINAVGYNRVPEELTYLSMTLGHIDINNFRRFYTAAYDTISVGGQTHQELAVDILQKANTLEPWFTPEDWVLGDDDVSDSPLTGARSAVAVVPNDYDEIDGEEMDIQAETAPVEDAHVVVTFPLDTNWVQSRLQRDSLDHVHAQVKSGDTPIAHAWRDMCDEFGISRPVEKFEEVRQTHIED